MQEKRTLLIPLLALIIPWLQPSVAFTQENDSLAWQPDTLDLEDVTITVTPFSTRLNNATGSLSLLRSRDLPAPYTPNIANHLNLAPGVFMASGTYSTNRLTIRGIGSRTPYSSNRIRAYLEEIPLTAGDGTTTLEDIDAAALGSVEILKGPASAVYGSGLGGVVKLNMQEPQNPGWSFRLHNQYGTWNTWRNAFTTTFRDSRSSLLAGYAHTSTDGYRQNSRYRRHSVFAHGTTQRGNHHLSATITGTRLYAEIPSSLSDSLFRVHPERAASNWLNINGYEQYLKLLGGVTWKFVPGNRWSNRLSIFTRATDPYEPRPFNILDERSAGAGLREQVTYRLPSLQVKGGTELYVERYQWKIFEIEDGNQGDLQTHTRENRQYANFFVHATWTPAPRIRLEAGGNLNVLEYALQTRYSAEGTDQSGRYRYQPIFSPRAGINVEYRDAQHLYASAGHGFSAPSVEETLMPDGLVNPDLKPETGWNMDLGLRGWLFGRRVYYDVAGYLVLVENLLVTERITEEIFTGINAGSSVHAGLEGATRIRLTPPSVDSRWSARLHSNLFISHNRFRSFVDEGIDYSGNRLPGIPSWIWQTNLHISFRESVKLIAGYRYTGPQYLNDDNDLLYEGYHLVNLEAAYTPRPERLPVNLTFRGGIRNLLNTRYASMILVNAPSFGGAPPRSYYPGLPRHVRAGMTLRF